MLSFGKSFSHSNGVNSTSADWVDTLLSASLLSHKGVTSPWGGGQQEESITVSNLHIMAQVFDLK